jgi:hypothetical protein
MPRPFHETLHHIHGGVLLDDAAAALAELVLAVDATGKAGTLTIAIMLRKTTARTMAATGKVTLKKPAEPEIETLFFPTPEGNLLTEDPVQMKLALKPVDVPSADALLTKP